MLKCFMPRCRSEDGSELVLEMKLIVLDLVFTNPFGIHLPETRNSRASSSMQKVGLSEGHRSNTGQREATNEENE